MIAFLQLIVFLAVSLFGLVTRVPGRRLFHVEHGIPYHVEDSMRGVLFAIKHLYGWIDLDCHVTRDGVLVVTHWTRPQVHDGFFVRVKGRLRKRRPHVAIEHMTWAQVQQLVTRDGYHIWRADVLIPFAIKHGIRVEAEAKTPNIAEAQWRGLLAKIPERDHDKLNAKAFPKFMRSLRTAHAAGITTIVLLHERGVRLPRAAQEYLTHYRGFPPIWK